jgi:hypothetical protein
MARIQYGCVSSRAGETTGLLAKFFNFEISGLADRFLMEIEENVNATKKPPKRGTCPQSLGAVKPSIQSNPICVSL